jgi:hypothetical protein
LLPGIDDQPVRSQIGALITFAEAARALEAHSDQALAMANVLRPGVKRSLLYIAMIAASTSRDTALGILPLPARDIAQLPAEQRVRLLSALATSLLHIDTQAAFGVLNQLVAACEDVRVNPRRGKFDPASVRRAYNSNGGTDSSLILPGNRGFYEAVQTARGRRNFGLRVPGVTAFTLGAFLTDAGTADLDRLTAAVLGLRDETAQSAAWVALAAVRLKSAAK